MPRIQVVIGDDEREAFREQARREGKSLSEWLREAGRERLSRTSAPSLRTAAQMQDFFAQLDAQQQGDGPEEDWVTAKARIAASRTAGLPRDT